MLSRVDFGFFFVSLIFQFTLPPCRGMWRWCSPVGKSAIPPSLPPPMQPCSCPRIGQVYSGYGGIRSRASLGFEQWHKTSIFYLSFSNQVEALVGLLGFFFCFICLFFFPSMMKCFFCFCFVFLSFFSESFVKTVTPLSKCLSNSVDSGILGFVVFIGMSTGLGFVVLLLSTLVCYQPTELIWASFFFHQFYNCTPPPRNDYLWEAFYDGSKEHGYGLRPQSTQGFWGNELGKSRMVSLGYNWETNDLT